MFLTNALGPLPVWAWLGVAGLGGGAYIVHKKSQQSDGTAMPGGQATAGTIDPYNAAFAWTSNQNLGEDMSLAGVNASANLSYADESFFGPLALPLAGPMDYSTVYGPRWRRRHRDRDGDDWRGGRRHHRRGGRWSGGGDLDDDGPAGAGGFGEHRWRGPGYPPAPPGGEGFDNGGQNAVGFGGGIASGGGLPFPQQTTVGASGNFYVAQHGDSIERIADKMWGPGSNGEALYAANRRVLGQRDRDDRIPAGLGLTIPGAAHHGPPAPGGPAGNGVGGGSVGANGYNYGTGPAGWDGTNQDASGGGSPSADQSWSNSSRVKSGNASDWYANGDNDVKNAQNNERPSRNRPRSGHRGRRGN